MIKCSVIIPAKNRSVCIERAVKSVQEQDIVNNESIEIIIVDDASTDDTSTIIKELINKINIPIKHITNKKSLGGAVARNQGAGLAKGEFIAFLDSDDEWLPHHLSSGIGLLESKQGSGVFGAFYTKENKKEKVQKLVSKKTLNISMGDYIFSNLGDTRTSTFIFEFKAFQDVMFDEKQQKHQDWDLAIRFDEKYEMIANEKTTAILHYDSSNRMSENLNHSATIYFLEKHEKSFKKNNLASLYLYFIKVTIKLEGKTDFYYFYQRNLNNLIRYKNVKLTRKQNIKRLLFQYFPSKFVKILITRS